MDERSRLGDHEGDLIVGYRQSGYVPERPGPQVEEAIETKALVKKSAATG